MFGGDNLTTKERISIIRLMGKIEKKPNYAKAIGISIINTKVTKEVISWVCPEKKAIKVK